MKTKLISIFLLLLTTLMAWGQGNEINFLQPVMSPEAAAIGKYGTYPVSHYTGNPDISIPLYTLKTRKVEIPIYLQYDASGFIPGKESGKVGHDWTLFAGGAITRSVNGVPDEFQQDGEAFIMHGHWYALNNVHKFNNDSIYSLKEIDRYYACETMPDLFSFHFGKHSGQFLIDHDGIPQVVGDGSYQIDISGLAYQHRNAVTKNSSIVITTSDGTRYTFGGTIDALELSLLHQTENGNLKSSLTNGIITAFYLTKIETPEGEVIEFNYAASGMSALTGYSDNDNIVKTCHYADGKFNPSYVGGDGAVRETTSNLTKVVYLKSIVSPAGTVLFNYKVREKVFMKGPAYWGTKIPLRLDNIEVVTPAGKHVKGIKFYQSFVQANTISPDRGIYCNRMFLDSLQVDKELYSFEYNSRNSLPRPETRGIDLRGFYNGYDSNSTLLALHYYSPYNLDFSHRQPNFSSALLGMLKKITYPTGGTTEFTYENHKYGRRIYRRGIYPYRVHITGSGLVGGLRIKEIKNSNGEIRTFKYETVDPDDNETVISSGVFNDVKQYALYYEFADVGHEITNLYISEANGINSCGLYSESDIVYSKVIEQMGNENGYTVYEYSNYDNCPDLPFLSNESVLYTEFDGTLTSQHRELLTLSASDTSQRLERGKLQKRSEYDQNDVLLRETVYTYSTDKNRKSKAIYSAGIRSDISGVGSIANSVAYYYYPNQVSREVVREYVNGQCKEQVTDYSYNARNLLLSAVSTSNSDGLNRRVEYSYPVDYAESPYTDMTDEFVISPVIEERHYVDSVQTKSFRNEYNRFHDKFFALGSRKATIGSGDEQILFAIQGYDERGNVLCLYEPGKPLQNYVWGYNYQYPLAVISGTLSDAALNSDTRQAIASSDTLSATHKAVIEALHENLPDALVTTYDYKPLVGMSYSKSPNGLCYYYEYDKYGHLASTSVETEENRVQETEYHTVNTFTSQLSLSFTDTSTSYDRGEHTFGINVTGGSDAYNYEWTLKSGNTVLQSGTDETLTYNFASTGNYTLECKVTDMLTRETESISRTFRIKGYQIQFSNVETSTNLYEGNVYVTADIVCEKATTVTFWVEYEVPGTLSSTNFTCKVRDYSFSATGKGGKEFTVDLIAGNNSVSLKLENIIVSAYTAIYISDVSTSECEVGPNNMLEAFY